MSGHASKPCSLKQFVRQHAQAIDGRRFDAEDNRAEGNGETAVAFGQGELGRGEIAFRSYQHQDAGGTMGMFLGVVSEDFLQVLGIGLERTNETEVRRQRSEVSEEILKGLRPADLRQPVLSALFG